MVQCIIIDGLEQRAGTVLGCKLSTRPHHWLLRFALSLVFILFAYQLVAIGLSPWGAPTEESERKEKEESLRVINEEKKVQDSNNWSNSEEKRKKNTG